MTNWDLAQLLNMTATRWTATEALSFGRTVQSLTPSTSELPIHVQPLSPDEVPVAYGYEDVGSAYQGFVQQDDGWVRGDMVVLATVNGSTADSSMVGKKFHVRGVRDDTLFDGIEHRLLYLELTDKTIST